MAQIIQQCLYCGASVLPYRSKYCRCITCGLILQNPMPSTDELANLYDTSWESPTANRRDTGGMNRAIAVSYAQGMMKELKLDTLDNQIILDFGAGRGDMLHALKQLGAEVYAVEPFGYEHIRKQGFPVFRGFNEIPEGLTFTGIFSSNVIEHLQQPWKIIKSLLKLIDDGGWLIVTTPNAEGLNARIRQQNWREYHKPGHIVLFSPNSMKAILLAAGFQEVQRLATHVDYGQGLFKQALHMALETVGMEGELKYLARKSVGESRIIKSINT